MCRGSISGAPGGSVDISVDLSSSIQASQTRRVASSDVCWQTRLWPRAHPARWQAAEQYETFWQRPQRIVASLPQASHRLGPRGRPASREDSIIFF